MSERQQQPTSSSLAVDDTEDLLAKLGKGPAERAAACADCLDAAPVSVRANVWLWPVRIMGSLYSSRLASSRSRGAAGVHGGNI